MTTGLTARSATLFVGLTPSVYTKVYIAGSRLQDASALAWRFFVAASRASVEEYEHPYPKRPRLRLEVGKRHASFFCGASGICVRLPDGSSTLDAWMPTS